MNWPRTHRVRVWMVVPLAGTVFGACVLGSSASAAEPSGVGYSHASVPGIAVVQLPQTRRTTVPAPLPTIGQPEPEKSPNVVVTLNALHRDSTGLTTLTWTVRTSGGKSFSPVGAFSSHTYKYASTYIAAVTVTDESAKLRYNPVQVIQSNTCVCSRTGAIPNHISASNPATLYNTYKLPESTKSVTVSIPGWAPLKDVPVN